MRKVILLIICFIAIQSFATEKKPIGNEWESPENLSLNKEYPRAYFFSFQDVESARKVLPENSKYWLSLNGDWDFNWAPDPESKPKDFYSPDFNTSSWDKIPVPSNWNIHGIQKDGSLKYGVPIYVNQPVIFQHTVKKDDWRGGVMRTPPSDWTTYKHRNEVGSYRRSFDIPKDWNNREVYISFDGVDSFFYIWINGKYIGFSKNSRNAARFNITPYITKGSNTIAVEVYRSSDGSFLEAQDMFRLPGIYRNVAIYSTPKVQIRDLIVIPDLDNTYTDGSLKISADISNLGKRSAKGYSLEYSLYENKLYSDENTKVENIVATASVDMIKSNQSSIATTTLNIKSPKKWSAETPYRYTLVAELKNAKNKTIETISTYIGFRKVEIKDTPASEDEFGLAGRYYYINGETVKLKGVNRHETNPSTGHVISRERMTEEIMLLKRANINHVRNAHYPDDPYWYYLCDKYGIYLEDEANIESHQYYYGVASLSHPIEWRDAHITRVVEMTHSTINHPSVVIWSLGNEAGPGETFIHAYNALKEIDTSRPVQYERNNSIVDMGSNQYPSIEWTREAVKGKHKIKYPFHISEYAHSMGNACGNLEDYWEAIESTNFFCGGAIWDWIDQSMYHYKKDGKRYLAYGGDFGDTPNDGQFVMNGLIFADMEPKPQYYEVQKVYQHIDIEAINIKKGEFEVFNKYYFISLDDFKVKWSIYQDGKKIESNYLEIENIPARERKTISIPYNIASLKDDSEYFVKIQFLLKKNQPWADANFVQAQEQILLKEASNKPSLAKVNNGGDGENLKISENSKNIKMIEGSSFKAEFDLSTGSLYSLVYGAETIISPGNGPKLDAFRAFVNNDNWFYLDWFSNGLHNLIHKTTAQKILTEKDGRIVLSFTVESQAPTTGKIHGGTWTGNNSIEELPEKPEFKFTTNQIWTVYKDGSIELQSSISSNKPSLILPRLGYVIKVPKDLSNFTYYGRGPIGNYNDRKSGQFIEEYKSTVAEQLVNFPKPQEMGNHEDVRWCALTNESCNGAIFISTGDMSVSVSPYSAKDLTLARHPQDLPKAEDTYLHLDLGVTGLGGNSCGQGGPLVEDRVLASSNNMGFIIRPTSLSKDLSEVANVSESGTYPISITRGLTGIVSISSLEENAEILYKIDGGEKDILYTGSIDLRNGGSIQAWYKNYPEIRATAEFDKILSIQTEVIYASSEEAGSSKYLTDGDPSSIWHTMYSITVAKHPHWVDLDAGEMKEFKGLNILPRQDGNNGKIKDYTIQVSTDGKDWGDPIYKGSFDYSSKEKQIRFEKPIKGRFIRFTAISSHRNSDFASCAEIEVLAE